MPRKKIIRTNLFPYHVTIRTNNKEWYTLPLKTMWKICSQAIEFANEKHPVEIQSFVLMSNHYHMIIWTPKCNLDKFMFELNSFISKEVRKRTGRINRIFGDRYKWTLINHSNYYKSVVRYVYQNPLRKNMCEKCEDYPFSSLHFAINKKVELFKVHNPIFGDKKEFLRWINTPVISAKYQFIKYGLKFSIFKVKKDKLRRVAY